MIILKHRCQLKNEKLTLASAKLRSYKSSGRNANKTSDSDENQALAKEKNDLLRQIDFLNSIILDTKLKEPDKSLLTTFWIFFRCGQLTFRMTDCEVNRATRYCKPPLALPFQVTVKGSREQ
ncbi:hypothetical protein TNCV_2195351 [Trichonephila clavipes]|uniref:Uncharacterized protein n=1 Tax=Trichonephila clavipes TaxID=2585209 RepID=A0A8X6VFH4_TRICX|nr:hypothetical protein TNCV_2195351 [Trichonephila clavipes]